jgi:hypothetical protein
VSKPSRRERGPVRGITAMVRDRVEADHYQIRTCVGCGVGCGVSERASIVVTVIVLVLGVDVLFIMRVVIVENPADRWRATETGRAYILLRGPEH